MKTRHALLAAATLGLAAFISAQKAENQVFSDKAGSLKIWNMSSHEITFKPGGDATFIGEGNPVRGESKKQNLTLECREVNAIMETLKDGGKNSLVLKKTDLSGSVIVTISGKSTKTLKTGAVNLTDSATEAVATMPGKFTFEDKGENVSFLSANKGSFTLDSLRGKAEPKVRRGSLIGSGHVDVKDKKGGHSILDSATINFRNEAEQTVFDFPSALEMETHQKDEDGTTDVNFSGSSGTISTNRIDEEKTEKFVLTADIAGPVKIKIVDTQPAVDKDKKPIVENGKAVMEVRTIIANAAKLTYNRATHKLTLTGNVTYSVESKQGSDEPLGASGQSDELTVTLTEKGKLLDYKAKSGKTVIGGGGGR